MNGITTTFDLRRFAVEQVLDSLADGAYATDLERTIVFWNRAAERITGWSRTEVVGRSCQDNILVHVDNDGHQLCGKEHCPLHRAIVTGETSATPCLIFAQTRAGTRIPVEVSVSPLRDAGGKVIGGIEVFRDLTATFENLRCAGIIQQHAVGSALPPDDRIEIVCRYTPHDIVSGDFYRAEKIDVDRYAVLVADVMGHGLPAALYTMQIRSLWEDLRTEWMRPARFVSELNRRLTVLTGPDCYFATAVYFLVDAGTGEVVYVNAGSPMPLLFGADGSMEELPVGGAALGFLREAEYAEAGTMIQPGGTLLVYTDGAIEIQNGEGEPLGTRGFVRLLRSKSFHRGRVSLDEIEEQLLEYCARLRLPDDLTLLTVSRPAAS